MYFYSSLMYNYFINALTNIFPALSLIAAHLTVPSCFGPPVYNCPHCSATLWYEERINRNKPTSNPQFSFCCMEGRVKLPLLKEPPPLLRYLLSPASSQTGSKYRRNIRTYNTMFAMASMGVRVDKLIKKKGPFCLSCWWADLPQHQLFATTYRKETTICSALHLWYWPWGQ